MLHRSTWRRVWRIIRGFPLLVALLGAAAPLTGSQALWLLFYAIVAAGLLGYAWSLLVTARLEPTIRALDDYAEAGVPLRVEVSARSAWHVPRWGMSVALPGVALPGVVTRDARLLRRGRNDFGRPGATATDPFGLVRLTKGLGEPYQLTGYPAMVPVAPDRIGVLGAASLRIGEGGSASARSTGTATSAGVREYVSGDSLSHVHWLSTAKRAELMTREFERGDPAHVRPVAGVEHIGEGNLLPRAGHFDLDVVMAREQEQLFAQIVGEQVGARHRGFKRARALETAK